VAADDDKPDVVRASWARRMRRSWKASERAGAELRAAATPAIDEIERLERELLDARRTNAAQDIEIAELRAQLEAAGLDEDGGS
jgi:hypothetical protein